METPATELELIDKIYECGFVPEQWPQVLRDISKQSNSAGASLFITNPEVTAWTASKNAHQITEKFVADGWYWRGQLMSRVHKTRHPGFLRDVDICDGYRMPAWTARATRGRPASDSRQCTNPRATGAALWSFGESGAVAEVAARCRAIPQAR